MLVCKPMCSSVHVLLCRIFVCVQEGVFFICKFAYFCADEMRMKKIKLPDD